MKTGLLILMLLCGSGQVCIKSLPGGLTKGQVTYRGLRPAGEIPGTLWIDDNTDDLQGVSKEFSAVIIKRSGQESHEEILAIPVIKSWFDPLFLDRSPPSKKITG